MRAAAEAAGAAERRAKIIAVTVLTSLEDRDLPQVGNNPALPTAVLLLVPALAGLQLLDLMGHAGGLRQARRWLLAAR